MAELRFVKIHNDLWEIPKTGGMRVPARIYASEKILRELKEDQAPQQVVNVAHLPGIVQYALAMPDIHWGYGFPIGGVAAFDLDEGVISPGGVGYDINCLTGSARVLHAYGYYRSIAEIVESGTDEPLCCYRLAARQPESARIIYRLGEAPRTQVWRVWTRSGDTIEATEDHPFWTPQGMVPLRALHPGDRVAFCPFEGVPYEAPSAEVILTPEAFCAVLQRRGLPDRGGRYRQWVRYLSDRGLLPLCYDSPALPFLCKLLGYLMGNGTCCLERNGRLRLIVQGQREDLEVMRRDLEGLGIRSIRLDRRRRRFRLQIFGHTYAFEREIANLHLSSQAFAWLLVALGMPVGDRAAQNYEAPIWLERAPRWQKRLWLAGLFGARLPALRVVSKRDGTFAAPVLTLTKQASVAESGRQFLETLARWAAELGVRTQAIEARISRVGRPKQLAADEYVRWQWRPAADPESLRALWGRIGYEYNFRRQHEAACALQYLKDREQTIRPHWQPAGRLLERWKAVGVPVGEASASSSNLPMTGLADEKPRGRTFRASAVGSRYAAFCQERQDGREPLGCVWEEIVRIEPVERPVLWVYDLTVDHPDHNFVANGFVVSNCGVRLLASRLTYEEIASHLERLVDRLFQRVPTGVGASGALKVSRQELRRVAVEGARWAVRQGFGSAIDLEFIEENGCIEGADPAAVSERAYERGVDQLGTLGSGNHFLEVGYVAQIFDEEAARVMGLFPGQVTVIIHTGSRGFGYQICDDYLVVMDRALAKYSIRLPDRQLACAPLRSPEGQQYLAAMRCGINFAFANRQIIAHNTRQAFAEAIGMREEDIGLRTVYEVAHNIAKIETHTVDGAQRRVCVHRKGATRAFPPGHPQIPAAYRSIGQPVLIPGDMGRYSYVLVGTEGAMQETFGSTCHGAGRQLSRTKAKKVASGRHIADELRARGIVVRGASLRTINEEIPEAYKDVAEVVEVCHRAGISRKVAQLRPLGCIKG